jgi:hypothetical protein
LIVGLSYLIQLLKVFYLVKFGFTLGEPISWVKVFRLFKLEEMFFGIESVDTIGRHLIYWQGQRVCDALFNIFVVPPSISAKIFLKNPYFLKFQPAGVFSWFYIIKP